MTDSERFRIIGPEMLPGADGANINGPSCIEVPAWVAGRLGRFYLYFAHHAGSYIRTAYADAPTGPWTIHGGGVLHLSDLAHCRDHVASPEVVIDEANRQIRLYYHAQELHGQRQLTWLATSPDGLHFRSGTTPLADFYLRVVCWRGKWLGMSKGGALYLSDTGTDGFRRLPAPAFPMSGAQANAPGDVRHVALDLEGDRLWVLFTRIGDTPEHIRLGYVDLLRPIAGWRVEMDAELLRPALDWEGARLAAAPGRAGAAQGAENALRDPAILRADGKGWLFYAFAGEQGIGLTALPDLADHYLRSPRAAVPATAANPAPEGPEQQLAEAVRRLEQPGALVARMADLDKGGIPRQRIYLMGCGRSGTWLLTSLMACFGDLDVIAKELPVEMFGLVRPGQANVLIKRAWDSYQRLDAIPPAVRILQIVRHPFDVLTSHNPVSKTTYHIPPDRWLGEMTALRRQADSLGDRLIDVTYENLVRDAAAVLARIGAAYGLSLVALPDEILRKGDLPAEAKVAMHGVRPVDSRSVGRWRSDPQAIAHLRAIVPGLGEMLGWMAGRYGYDISLP